MLNCREATRLCSQGLDRRLSLREQLGLHTHLMVCSGCMNFSKQTKFLRDAIRAYSLGNADLPTSDRPTSSSES